MVSASLEVPFLTSVEVGSSKGPIGNKAIMGGDDCCAMFGLDTIFEIPDDYPVVEDTLFDEISREKHPDTLLEKKGIEVEDTLFEDTSTEEHLETLAEKISLVDIVVEDTSLEDTIPNLECTVE